jgi:16S rRNA (cytidine1402-2'-O)-methyltransferase
MKLALVPTPIGNLEDITLRGLRYLKECDWIFCEDTRYSSKLLSHYDIQKPLWSYHLNNEHKTLEKAIEKIKSVHLACLITDAGTPGISDPGYLLVRACLKEGIEVECLPGATAFVPALVMSGFPCEKFYFEGFLPQKKGRETRIKALLAEEKTSVLYESTHRIEKTIDQFIQWGDPHRLCCIARELSKIHEEIFRGTLEEAKRWIVQTAPKGEFVFILSALKD